MNLTNGIATQPGFAGEDASQQQLAVRVGRLGHATSRNVMAPRPNWAVACAWRHLQLRCGRQHRNLRRKPPTFYLL